MTLRSRFGAPVAQYLTSESRAKARRQRFEEDRRRRGAPHEVWFFHRPEDPHSQLVLSALPQFTERFRVRLRCATVPAPPPQFEPRAEILAGYEREDAAALAARYGLDAPALPRDAAERDAALSLLVEAEGGDYLAAAETVTRAFRNGQRLPVAERPTAALRANQERLQQLGHFASATLFYGGEWYWKLDRLHYLERRLEALSAGDGGTLSRRTTELEPLADETERELDYFFSVRSPYSYLSVERTAALCRDRRITLRLRPVLPMMMTELPVPPLKRRYLLQDAAREALHRGIPFGRIADPIGRPAERVLAVLINAAVPNGVGLEFVRVVMRQIWAEGVDFDRDRNLLAAAESVGLSPQHVRSALRDESWREVVGSNRREMEASGLPGVPGYRVGGRVVWGQDRLWRVRLLL
jgi:2-hydroxychromene-2-carboxylate isomerase